MKKLLMLLGVMATLLIFASCSKNMVVYSGELQQKDTIFIVPVPGYSYNVSVEKTKGEILKDEHPSVISTSSGKIVNIPGNGDLSTVLFKTDSLQSPSSSSDVNVIEGTDQDTVHIYYIDTGVYQFINCKEGEVITIYCGDNVIRIPCRQGTVVECDE